MNKIYFLNSNIIPREFNIITQATNLMYGSKNHELWEDNNYLKVLLAPNLVALIRKAQDKYEITEEQAVALLTRNEHSDAPLDHLRFITNKGLQKKAKKSLARFGSIHIEQDGKEYLLILKWDKKDGLFIEEESILSDTQTISQ